MTARLAAVLLCFCMMAALFGAAASAAPEEAAGDAAMVGEESYPTLQDAINDVGDDQTITLLRDVKENITSESKNYTLDMGGVYTVDGDAKAAVFTIKSGEVTLQNGTITNGSTTGYGGGLNITGGTVTVSNVNITGNTAKWGGGVYIKGAVVSIEGGTVSGNSAKNGGGIYIDDGTVSIEGGTVSGNAADTSGTAIFADSETTSLTMTNCKVNKNKGPSSATGDVAHIMCDMTANGCEFSYNNTEDGAATNQNGYVLFFSLPSKSRTLTGCTITGNKGFQSTIKILNTKSITFEECEISGNTASAVAGILCEGGTCTLTNTVVTGNTSDNTGVDKNTPGCGGVAIKVTGFTFESGAIYGNGSADNKANDIYVEAQKSATLIEASEMRDDGQDFTGYIWRDHDGSEYSPTSGTSTDALKLTASDNTPHFVAQVGDDKYKTLSAAVEAVREGGKGNTIVLIAGDDREDHVKAINTDETVTLDIPVTINLNGCSVIAGKGMTGPLFTVTIEDVHFTGTGEISGQVKVENNGELYLASTMTEFELDVTLAGDDAKLCWEDGYNITNLNVTLPEETVTRLNEPNMEDEDYSVTVLYDGAGHELAGKVTLSGVTNPQVTVQDNKENNNLEAVNPGLGAGVFVGSDGNDGQDGKYGTPVLTVEKAIEKLKGNSGTIFLKDTVTVSGTEKWAGAAGQEVIVKRYSPSKNQGGKSMVNIARDGSLTLENITLDGEAKSAGEGVYTNTGSLIEVSGTLTLNSGAELCNNSVMDTRSSEGGAISASGTVMLEEGCSVHDNYALHGAGIYMDGSSAKLIMHGGDIYGNVSDGTSASGGGVLLLDHAEMELSGGKIYKNTAHFGGGIALGTGDSLLGEFADGKIHLTMTGGTVTENLASYSGGGIFIQSSYNADITGGSITFNRCVQGGPFGGGGIYVNGGKSDVVNGRLRVWNALITRNIAEGTGGALAACSTSATTVHTIQGSEIYGNTGHYSSGTGSGQEDDILISTSATTDDITGLNKDGGADHISEFMLDGTPYQWKLYGDGTYATQDYLNSPGGKHLYTDATPGEGGTIAVRITDNYSGSRGGGIGSNGDVIIGGEYVDPAKLSASKTWTGGRPENLTQLNIWVLGMDREDHSKVVYVTYNQLFVAPDWRNDIKFEDLSNEYDYVILEEAVYGNVHVWSDNGKEHEDVVRGVMDVMYGTDSEIIWSDDPRSYFTYELKETESTDESGNKKTDHAFTNTSQYGLMVKKIVAGGSEDDEFTFTVTLKDAAGGPVSGTYGEMTFNNGAASFKLKGGQSRKATGLTPGWTYTVTEAEANANGYTTTAENDAGTIAAGVAEAVFTNSKGGGGPGPGGGGPGGGPGILPTPGPTPSPEPSASPGPTGTPAPTRGPGVTSEPFGTPAPTGRPGTTPAPAVTPAKSGPTAPATGDDTAILPWALLLAASCAGLALVLRRKT